MKQSNHRYRTADEVKAARISLTKNRLLEDLQSFDRRWLIGITLAVLLAPLLLVGLCLRLAPQTAKHVLASKSPVPAGTRRMTVRGVMPSEPVDGLRLSCLGAVVQLDKPAASLAKPGEPFTWEVEIPTESGQVVVEMQRGGQHWKVATGSPETPVLALPVVVMPELLAGTSKPFKSPFTSAKPLAPSFVNEGRRRLEELRAKQSELRSHRDQARQSK